MMLTITIILKTLYHLCTNVLYVCITTFNHLVKMWFIPCITAKEKQFCCHLRAPLNPTRHLMAEAEWGVKNTRVQGWDIGQGRWRSVLRDQKEAIRAFIWPDGGVNENRSAVRSVGRWLSAVVCLPAIKLLVRWRAFLSCSHTYRSNSDKWDVTALVKQGYNLSKYNIICDLTWQPCSLFPTSRHSFVGSAYKPCFCLLCSGSFSL